MSANDYAQGDLWSATGAGEGPVRRWVFHVDMDAFFASVEQRDNPALSGLPVIVGNSPISAERLQQLAAQARRLPRMPEFIRGVRGVVASASYEARAFGVRSAMPLARALALCPGAVVVHGRFDRYRQVAEQLRAIWADFSPAVEPVSLDEAYLEMTGAELAGGPILGIAQRLKARIRAETGLTASVGVAPNKLVAKVASDLQKPDGLVLVPHGEEAATLAPLPVRALQGVGKRTESLLVALGIHTLGQLAVARRTVLAAHLGLEHADSLIRHAQGIDHSVVEPPGDPKSISRETTLVEDTIELATLRKIMAGLADHVAWSLRGEGMCARCVYIKLRLLPARRRWSEGGDSGFGRLITRQATMPVPIDSANLLHEAACKLLDAAARSTGLRNGSETVRLIGVGASRLVHTADLVGQFRGQQGYRKAGEQSGAQSAPSPDEERLEQERKLSASIDAVRKKYGYAAIASASAASLQRETDGAGVVDG